MEKSGADVNARDSDGFTALHYAACVGDDRIAVYLLDKGADHTIRSVSGRTALDLAGSKGYLEVARAIVQRDLRKN